MKVTLFAVSVAMATVLVAGCSDDSEPRESGYSGSPETETPRSSVNPVDVLKKVDDCTIPAGVTMGERDAYGNLYASCEIEDVEFGKGKDAYVTSVDVTVRAVNPDTIADQGYENAEPDDSHKVIFGDGFYLTLSASPEVFGTGAVDVDAIAAAVDAEVQ